MYVVPKVNDLQIHTKRIIFEEKAETNRKQLTKHKKILKPYLNYTKKSLMKEKTF